MLHTLNQKSVYARLYPLVLQIILVGCSSPTSQSDLIVAQPEVLLIDGSEWVRQPWGKKHESMLNSYFRRTPQLAENPAIRGTPVCYRNGSRQRFYWLSPIDATSRWAMVEFKGSKGDDVVEGIGAPFSDLVETEK